MEPEHHDPFSEGGQRALERLMALGVLVEAGSRLAAENARSKAARDDQYLREQDRREAASRRAERDQGRWAAAAKRAERFAAADTARRARQWARFAADDERLRGYLAGLPFQEVARHWGQAALHADSDPTAATVLAACEDDLRRRAPSLIDFYRQQRDRGVTRREAMARAAAYVWSGAGPARSHGGRPPTAGALTRIGAELDQEITRLAGALDPVERARLTGVLEDNGWSAQSLAYIETLLDRATAERHSASAAAGTPDDPATVADEHQAAREDAAVMDGCAGGHAAHAAAMAAGAAGQHPAHLAAQSFPLPARQAITAHPAAMPSTHPSARPTRRRSR